MVKINHGLLGTREGQPVAVHAPLELKGKPVPDGSAALEDEPDQVAGEPVGSGCDYLVGGEVESGEYPGAELEAGISP